MRRDDAAPAESDRIAAILVRAATAMGELRAACPPSERMRWRRAQQILATAAAEIGCPDLFGQVGR